MQSGANVSVSGSADNYTISYTSATATLDAAGAGGVAIAVNGNLNAVPTASMPGAFAQAVVASNTAAGLGGQRVGTVTLTVGNSAARPSTWPGTTISLTNNLTVNPFPGASSATGASINGGSLNLQSQLATTSVARTFTVNDTPAVNDLFISSVIADGNNGTGAAYNPTNPIAASLTKNGTGNGRLVLAGTSTYTSTTSITAGIVTMENPAALGESLGNNVQAIAVNGGPTAARSR